MRVETIPIERITVDRRLRSTTPAQVEALASSIAECGLLQPISVYERKVVDGGVEVGGYGLIAGLHRLEAHQKLGLVNIEAAIFEGDELHRQLGEVDENLIRAELGHADRAAFTRRRKEIYEALHPETRQHVAGGHAKHGSASDKMSFAADTAAKTGRDVRTVERDVERANKIPVDVLNRIRGTSLDSGVYLDRLKALEPDAMREKVADDLRAIREAEGKQREREARKRAAAMSDQEAMEKWIETGLAWWNKGAQPWRDEFMARIDQPVFDKTNAGRAA